MADGFGLDEELLARRQALVDARLRLQRANDDAARAGSQESLSPRVRQRVLAEQADAQAAADRAEGLLRQVASQRSQAQWESQVAAHQQSYRDRIGQMEQEVAQWRPPPHPSPDKAFAAEESPQLAYWYDPRLWNRPLVKTRGMWERDNRAAELARRIQAERKVASAAGPAQLAAFDSLTAGADLVDTSVRETWDPGLEPWGLLNKAMSYPSAWGSMFGGAAQAASGAALAAAGLPNYAADKQEVLERQTENAADDVLFNLPTKLAYMATGNKRYAPAYARAYWDEVSRRERAPVSVLRPLAELPRPENLSADLSGDTYDVVGDLLKNTGLSDQAKGAIQVPAMIAAGSVTDMMMPNYAAAKPLQRAGMFAKDLAAGGAIVGALPVAAGMSQSRSELERQFIDNHYDRLLQAVQSQNRITP